MQSKRIWICVHEETIKKIEGFNYLLKKYVELNYHYNSSIFYDSKSFNDFNKEGVDLAKLNSNTFINDNKTLKTAGSNADSSIIPQNGQLNFSLTPNPNQNHDLSGNNNNSQLKSMLSSQNLNEVISNKKLRLLTKSYFHPIILIILLYCIVLPSYFLVKHMNTLDTEIIDIQSYFFSSIFAASEKLIGMKLIMSNGFYYEFNVDYSSTSFDLNNSIKKKQIISTIPKFPEIFDLYRKNGIEPKRVQFVYEKANKESTLVLVEGQKGGKPGLKIEKPFILYNEDGTITSEYDNLCKEVRKWFKKAMMAVLHCIWFLHQ